MVMCQLILQSESAYSILAELGDAGVLHFCDVSVNDAQFRRIFVNEIFACVEMERILDSLSLAVAHLKVSPYFIHLPTPSPREYVTLLENLAEIKVDVFKVKDYMSMLEDRKMDLQLQADVFRQIDIFLQQANVVLPSPNQLANSDDQGGATIAEEKTALLHHKISSSLKLQFVNSDMQSNITGAQLKVKVEKACIAYRAKLYPFIAYPQEREEAQNRLRTEVSDIITVLEESKEHQRKLLADIASKLPAWRSKVRKLKAIFYTMSLFNLDLSDHCLIGECWCPAEEQTTARAAIERGSELAGASKPSLLLNIFTTKQPPTYNKTSEFTRGFQKVVDAYGIPTYKEVNPACFTTTTFPFLFGVMFGDVGHGTIMMLMALFMVIFQKFIMERNIHKSEMLGMLFDGRYIILLMGFFSIYAGFIYNDAFGNAFNIFGSSWRVGNNADLDQFLAQIPHSIKANATLFSEEIQAFETSLDPGSNFKAKTPYPYGIDPIWELAKNQVSFTNSFKMKMSVIFAVLHMSFGITLSCFNYAHHKEYMAILLEYIPQILFLWCMFGYLVVIIFYKWIHFVAEPYGCAPSLLSAFINMFMVIMKSLEDNKINPDGSVCLANKFYQNQDTLQKVLLVIIILCIPVMLLVVPLIKRHRQNLADEEHQQEGHGAQGFGDVMVVQGIHTIEFCLGVVSNTASYLRLWALGLAHAQLADVLWTKVLNEAFTLVGSGWIGIVPLFIIFAIWAAFSLCILVFMEGMSAFLHTLRLHWVEFQNKFYAGEGYLYAPFSFRDLLDL
ncbi:V-type proton ATPase 116 kDa subunit a isoform 4 [Hypsibius exemplaris]|uniref:V-type proton ATPase subunit a n=1 Tax=Hypsibius exemplaris TaxID=2072580 RepID=A0A1W0X0A2_HYPEX|nr:V-type proton ATPase 116 kDa subunit a isoform 4 [Hypsibius exemplaris]